MCGRFTLFASGQEIRAHFDLQESFDWSPRYNITPGESIPAVGSSEEGDSLGIHQFRWGLIPHWVDDPDDFSANLINARAETVASKPSFRDSFRKRRCLIPASGFYEWTETDEGKKPYFFQPSDADVIAFSGLWDRWEPANGEDPVLSCAILTTEASPSVADVHHRMPVIMAPDQYESWLEPSDTEEMLESMVSDPDDIDLEVRPVDPRVNRPDVDDPECIEPID
jgi:putative SOS response-associated peptidase YedK